VVLLNGHGGNIIPAQQALFEARQRRRERPDLLLISTTYWTLGAQPAEADGSFHQRQMGHACEWETSMMLRLRPDLVRGHQSLEPIPLGRAFAPAQRAWVTKDRSEAGHIGEPHRATAEKGETLFQLFSA